MVSPEPTPGQQRDPAATAGAGPGAEAPGRGLRRASGQGSQPRSPWTRHDSAVVHANPWFRVERDTVTRPDGAAGEYYVVRSSPAVFVVACDPVGRVALVALHRYTVDTPSLEVPAGSVDPGERPLDAARRELAEETGLSATSWRQVGLLHPANGLLAEDDYVFVASELTEQAADGGNRAQAAEGITEVRFVGLGEALAMGCSGEITDGQTVAALALAAVDRGLLR
jgi:8-oxo-dGTP pyrophosphatase MutT (NUDIX family)